MSKKNSLTTSRFARVTMLMLAVVLLGGLLLAWDDARGKEQNTIKHPTGSGDVIVRIELRGGFVMPITSATRNPIFTLYGDGSYIVEGAVIAIYPEPAVPSLVRGRLTEDGVQQVLRDARDAGLLDGDVNDMIDIIADAATTVFTVNADGKTFMTSVYAFEEADSSVLTAEQIARRARLHAFMDSLPIFGNGVDADLVAQPEQPYDFDRVQLFVIPGAPTATTGIEQNRIEWPLAQGLAEFGAAADFVPGANVGVVGGADLDLLKDALLSANTESVWVTAGAEFTVIVQPLLPDQTGETAPQM